MGSSIKHAPGTFCWAELTTSDSAGAKSFYSELIGWETHDDPIPGGGVYTMVRTGGGDAGAMYQMTDEMKGMNIPPNWLPYVTVANAAETAAQAKSLGGSVLKDAFDVMEVGAMAVLQDPTGGVFAVWQPKAHTGFDHIDGRPGTVCWNEILTNDVEKAGQFYSALFGWGREVMDMGPTPYTMFTAGEAKAGGMIEITEAMQGAPPCWMIYFSVADCDATAEKTASLGGRVMVPPTDIPNIGRFSVASDPQGAVFCFIALRS